MKQSYMWHVVAFLKVFIYVQYALYVRIKSYYYITN